jgi:hypothetical protein
LLRQIELLLGAGVRCRQHEKRSRQYHDVQLPSPHCGSHQHEINAIGYG